jgi:serine/threonine protein kinase
MSGERSTHRPTNDATRRESIVCAPRHELHDLIVAEWRQTPCPDLVRTIEDHPEVLRDSSLLLNLAIEEYRFLRSQSGEIDLREHCQRFGCFGSSIEKSVLRQLETEKYLADHPELLGIFSSPEWPEIGDDLGGFIVLDELGRGGVSRVYLCHECEIGNREVVVKATPLKGEEASTLGRLDHPNIIPIHSTGTIVERNLNFICMPYRGRSTLVDLLDVSFRDGVPRDGRVLLAAAQRWCTPDANLRQSTWRRVLGHIHAQSYFDCVLHLGLQLAAALEHAHSEGILHGDLKPSNVLLTEDGRPLLLDFNLSRHAFESLELRGGTLPYMPPEHLEQIANLPNRTQGQSEDADPRSDIFSFGAVMFELLTGSTPVNVKDAHADPPTTARQLLNRFATTKCSIRQSNPWVSRRLEDLILRCLAVSPNERPATMGLVIEELRRECTYLAAIQRKVKSRPKTFTTVTAAVVIAVSTMLGYWFTRPPRFESSYRQGLSSLSAGDFKNAVGHLQRSLNYNPAFRPAKVELARALLHDGEIDAAIQELGQLVKDRQDVHSMALMGYCFNLINSPIPAIYWYQEALKGGIQSAAVHNNLGASYLAAPLRLPLSQRISEPESHLLSALQLAPGSDVITLNLLQVEIAKARSSDVYEPGKALAYVEAVKIAYPEDARVLQIVTTWCALATRWEDSLDFRQRSRITSLLTTVTPPNGAKTDQSPDGRRNSQQGIEASQPQRTPRDASSPSSLFFMDPH